MKDPAFLFYSSDFLTGTMFMSDEQVGKYIRLICAQHQKGRLTEKDMLHICKSYDKDIFSKFTQDEAGFYYSERLEVEIVKRQKYSESRRSNRLKGSKAKKEPKSYDTTYDESYDEHMENENRNIDKKINTIPELNVFLEYGLSLFPEQTRNDYKFSLQSKYESWVDAKWRDGHGKPIKNWKLKVKQIIPFLKPFNNGSPADVDLTQQALKRYGQG